MGEALANKIDQHLLQLIVLAARSSATTNGTGSGNVITDADANTNAASLITSIFELWSIIVNFKLILLNKFFE